LRGDTVRVLRRVETFVPYWMVDPDNTYNVCGACYERGQG
jgi:hypothetical protein